MMWIMYDDDDAHCTTHTRTRNGAVGTKRDRRGEIEKEIANYRSSSSSSSRLVCRASKYYEISTNRAQKEKRRERREKES